LSIFSYFFKKKIFRYFCIFLAYLNFLGRRRASSFGEQNREAKRVSCCSTSRARKGTIFQHLHNFIQFQREQEKEARLQAEKERREQEAQRRADEEAARKKELLHALNAAAHGNQRQG